MTLGILLAIVGVLVFVVTWQAVRIATLAREVDERDNTIRVFGEVHRRMKRYHTVDASKMRDAKERA